MGDLRQWLAAAEALGEVRALRGIPADLDIGVIAELTERKLESPALLFDEIPGYRPGFRVLTNALGSGNRFALTVGLPSGLSQMEMIQEWRRRAKAMKPLPTRAVDGGPVLENSAFGEEVDVLIFPAPHWHEKDGGRYIGTGDAVITRGPQGDWVNLGTYRVMVHDRNHVGLHIGPGHHGDLHMQGWFAQGKPMPVAIVIGADPLLFLVAGRALPAQASEYEYAGAMRGEPIEVMPGPVTGLPIPAGAEIVLEGFVDPQERWPEGPFGEYTGYYAGGVRPEHVVRVEGLHYRHDPIILGAPPLKPRVARDHYMDILRAALLWDALEEAGVPDVTGVAWHVAGAFLAAVALRQRYPGHAKQAGRIAAMCYASVGSGRYTVVVDDDIDVTDMGELLWALCTRVDPERDIEVLGECRSSPLDPIIPPERKGNAVAARVVIDATRPYEWRERFPEVVASSPELRQQVLARWGEKLRGII